MLGLWKTSLCKAPTLPIHRNKVELDGHATGEEAAYGREWHGCGTVGTTNPGSQAWLLGVAPFICGIVWLHYDFPC
jgi:membrane peptidoglycan carboxypeptidase